MDGLPEIIPKPKAIYCEPEKPAVCINGTVCACSADERFWAECFASQAEKVFGVKFSVNATGGDIRLCRDAELDASEYRVTVTEGGAVLSYSAAEGLNYAFATLLQLLCAEKGELRLPVCELRDRPDSAYRALMVDVARKKHTLEELLAYVDLCWLYKIRLFHIHFADTNAYTLPSSLLPELPGAMSE